MPPSSSCDYLADPALSTPALSPGLCFTSVADVVALFRRRARLAVETAAGRVQEELAQPGAVRDTAMNLCAVDLVAASQAHGRHLLLSAFAAQADAATPPAVRKAMQRLCLLFATTDLQERGGEWAGLLTPAHHRAVRATVRGLLAELRPDSVALVDAFEFPDNVLVSALGRHDGNVYESLFAAAQASPLNGVDPFPGYARVLRPHLDREFLREHAAMVRATPHAHL